MSVGLLIISHSAKVADGLVELAAQMAPAVRIVPAGGSDDGGLGTSFDLVHRGMRAAQSGNGVLILVDLGSAAMIAEAVLDLLDDDQRSTILLVPEAPLVEGAVAAAVAAQTGADLPAVAAAARAAIPLEAATASGGPPDVSGQAELINPMGLHARPAAILARALTSMDAEVTINEVDAKSVMLLMTLGLRQGQMLSTTARGPDAHRAVELVLDQTRNGFGEV